jgi:hypothetical protein
MHDHRQLGPVSPRPQLGKFLPLQAASGLDTARPCCSLICTCGADLSVPYVDASSPEHPTAQANPATQNISARILVINADGSTARHHGSHRGCAGCRRRGAASSGSPYPCATRSATTRELICHREHHCTVLARWLLGPSWARLSRHNGGLPQFVSVARRPSATCVTAGAGQRSPKGFTWWASRPLRDCRELADRAALELRVSRRILDHDLFRTLADP